MKYHIKKGGTYLAICAKMTYRQRNYQVLEVDKFKKLDDKFKCKKCLSKININL